MDEDRAALERLFGRAEETPDAGLLQLFETIAAEMAAHFAREEKAMMDARAPVLLALIELHQQASREIERMRAEIGNASPEAARQLIGALLPLVIRQQLATADAVIANDSRRRRQARVPTNQGGGFDGTDG
jgi:hemerythrin